MNKTLKKRIKAYLWQGLGIAFVASASYLLQVGDIWKADIKVLINAGVIAALGLFVAQVTKAINPSKE